MILTIICFDLFLASGGGALFTFGLNEARLGRSGGDNSIPEIALPNLKVTSIGASRHSVVSTVEGLVWTMGHNDSKGGGGHGSPPLDASGQLGRGGTKEAGRVTIEVESLSRGVNESRMLTSSIGA